MGCIWVHDDDECFTYFFLFIVKPNNVNICFIDVFMFHITANSYLLFLLTSAALQ